MHEDFTLHAGSPQLFPHMASCVRVVLVCRAVARAHSPSSHTLLEHTISLHSEEGDKTVYTHVP